MFWVALASQGALSGGLFVIYYFQRNMGFKVFHGPPEWDYLQLVMSGFAALVWEEVGNEVNLKNWGCLISNFLGFSGVFTT